MKRRLVRIFVFLLLGAIVNVAIAWGATCLWNGSVVTRESTFAQWDDPSGRRYTAIVYRSAAFSTIWGTDANTVNTGSPALTDVPSWSFADEEWRWGIPRRGSFGVRDDAAGWPFPALRCRFVGDQYVRGAFAEEFRVSNEGIAITPVTPPPPSGQKVGIPRALPLRPIWPGFAINTVFYAFVLWLLFAGPFVLRRRRRIRRGLCPKCAYDLRGTPRGAATACPECSAAISLAHPTRLRS